MPRQNNRLRPLSQQVEEKTMTRDVHRMEGEIRSAISVADKMVVPGRVIARERFS